MTFGVGKWRAKNIHWGGKKKKQRRKIPEKCRDYNLSNGQDGKKVNSLLGLGVKRGDQQ